MVVVPKAVPVALPAAVAKAAPVVVAAKAGAPAPFYGGNYEYAEFAGGHLVFSEILQKINAHCLHPDHQTTKCHLEFQCFRWKFPVFVQRPGQM